MKKIFFFAVALIFLLSLSGCAGAGFVGSSRSQSRVVSESYSETVHHHKVHIVKGKANGYLATRIAPGGTSTPAVEVRHRYSFVGDNNKWSQESQGTSIIGVTGINSCGEQETVYYNSTYQNKSGGWRETPRYYNPTWSNGTIDTTPGIKPGFVQGSFGLGKKKD